MNKHYRARVLGFLLVGACSPVPDESGARKADASATGSASMCIDADVLRRVIRLASQTGAARNTPTGVDRSSQLGALSFLYDVSNERLRDPDELASRLTIDAQTLDAVDEATGATTCSGSVKFTTASTPAVAANPVRVSYRIKKLANDTGLLVEIVNPGTIREAAFEWARLDDQAKDRAEKAAASRAGTEEQDSCTDENGDPLPTVSNPCMADANDARAAALSSEAGGDEQENIQR